MTMREKVSALHLVVLILISAAVVTTIALDGSEKKRETAGKCTGTPIEALP